MSQIPSDQELREAVEILNFEDKFQDIDCSCHLSPPCKKCVETPDKDMVENSVLVLKSLATAYLESGEGFPEKIERQMGLHHRLLKLSQSEETWNECCDAHRLAIVKNYVKKSELPSVEEIFEFIRNEYWFVHKEVTTHEDIYSTATNLHALINGEGRK